MQYIRNLDILFLLIFVSCNNSVGEPNICSKGEGEIMYAEIFGKLHGQGVYFDFDQAKACSKEINTPLLVIFGAWGGNRFKLFYESVMNDVEIDRICKNNFVIVYLYADDRSPLPSREQDTSLYTNERITTLGNKNSELQIKLDKSGSQPKVIIVDDKDKILSRWDTGDLSKEKFRMWIQTAISILTK